MAFVIADVLLISPNSLIRPVSIEVDEAGTISQIHEGHDPPKGSKVIFDGGGELKICSGFIYIHTHGANGIVIKASSTSLTYINIFFSSSHEARLKVANV